jgi:phytoene desaturase
MTPRVVQGPTDHVVVVGAGLAGLSAAMRLAGAGRRVTVLEREARPGGRAGLVELAAPDGAGTYRIDNGPTVLTMPDLIADCFDCLGEDLADWLDLVPVTPLYRSFHADGSRIDVHADPAEMAEELRRTCGPQEAAGYQRYVDFVSRLYRYEMSDFIDRNIDSPLDLLTANLARLVALGAFRRLAPKVAQYLRDERTQRLFSFQAMYAGLSPARALALYAVITYMDCVQGVYFPEGGMHAVPRALAGAAARHGVQFRYDTTVTRIEVAAGRATAVITAGGERIPADVVVVNADLPTAYGELLPPGYTPRRVRRASYSPSAVVLHAGSSYRLADPVHHTIDFGQAWETTFDEIIDRGELMSDPSFLVTNPTVTDPSLAPADRNVYYVLFPAPNMHRARFDWTSRRAAYREQMLETLEARGYEGFGEGIETSHLVTPVEWQAQGMFAGAPFAATHSFAQTGPFRAPTLDRSIENLVFTGSNTQPGVGVPMVLLSGRLAAERVIGPARVSARVLQ